MTEAKIREREILLAEDLKWNEVPVLAWINAAWLYVFGNGAVIDPIPSRKRFERDILPSYVTGVTVSPRVIGNDGLRVIRGRLDRIKHGGGTYRYSSCDIKIRVRNACRQLNMDGK